jgi:hypothetical protein
LLGGAAHLSLDALDAPEARELFVAIVGAPRAAREPEATAAVLACCAGLPLAIRIAGSRLTSRPAWSIGGLAARLAGERERRAELAVGDLAVRASFALCYRPWAPTGQRWQAVLMRRRCSDRSACPAWPS